MKIYLIKDTEYNRMFNDTNDRIGKAYKGIEIGEYIDLQIEDNKSIKVLASELKVIEGKNLYVRNEVSKRNKDLKYYGLAVTKKGYQIVIGINKKTNHINDKEYDIIQDVIIYNNETFEILYENRNVYMFLKDTTKTFINIFDNIDTLLYGIDKYAEMNEYNKNKMLDKLFDMNILLFNKLEKERMVKEKELKEKKENEFYNNAIEDLKEELKRAENKLNDNNIILVNNKDCNIILMIKIKDNKIFDHYNSNNGKKYLYNQYYESNNIYNNYADEIKIIKVYDNNNILKNRYETYKDIIEYSNNLKKL